MADISVILAFYNQSLESLEKSIRSVAVQKGCDYELIIADDHSDLDLTEVVPALCLDREIADFRIIRHERNLQTVGNILHTKGYVSSPYVKAFTTGDELYGDHALADILSFMKQHNAQVGFGSIIKDVDGLDFGVPRNAREYPLSHSTSRRSLFKHQVLLADWIPAGAQLFESSLFFRLMEALFKDYGIRYCEILAGLLALTKCDVYHYVGTILRYEVGTGISTSGSIGLRKRIYNDHAHLYESLRESRPFGIRFILASVLFEIRKFIALKFPFYRFFQKLAMRSYSD